MDSLLITLFLALWAILFILGRMERVKKRGVEVKPFFLIYRMKGADAILEKITLRFRRVLSIFAKLSIVISLIAMIFAVSFLTKNLYSYLFVKAKGFAQVMLLLPGLTIQTPMALTYFFLTIPFIIVVHEGAHGLVAKLERIRVKSGGIVLFLTLIGAFVEPHEEDFKKAHHSARLKVYAVGSSANILFSLIVITPLLATPTFAPVLPDSLRNVFYAEPSGVLVRAILPNSPAEKAGLQVNDVIIGVNGSVVKSLLDYERLGLKPNQTVKLTVLRGGSTITLEGETMPYVRNRSRGVLGFGGITYQPPRFMPQGVYWPTPVALFFFWLWFLSFNVGIFNMLPFYPLDGDGFINTLLGVRLSGRVRRLVRGVINICTLSLLAGNLLASLISYGLFTI